MSKKQVKISIGTLLLILILINLPFLPGPNILNGLGQIFFSIGQIIGTIGLLGAPIGFIWIIINKTRKLNIFRPLLFTIIFFVPLISILFLTRHLRDFSREIGIKNGNKLVRQIEEYKLKNGNYPEHIDKTIFTIPHSSIIGIDHYNYQKTENNFEVSFTQNVLFGFNFEIVTYNNGNEQKPQGELQTLYKTNDKNWKYEIFD